MHDTSTPDVSRQRLDQLLLEGESQWLDFKAAVSPSQPDEMKELAKDVAALADRGGWIVVGVDDNGQVVGLSPQVAALFDEARLRPRLRKLLGEGLQIHSSQHELDDSGGASQCVVILHVLPHPQGACVIPRDIQLSDGRTVVARAGDILTRHSSSSTRIDGGDLSRILDKRSRIAEARDLAARHARMAALNADNSAEALQRPAGGQLISMGWATSQRPADLARRIFYSGLGGIKSRLWSALEGRQLRRDGHYFDNCEGHSGDMLRRYGYITHGLEADAFVDVRVHVDGWISIAAWECVPDWTPEERFGWWVHGACETAHILMAELQLRGDLYTCLRFKADDGVRLPLPEASLEQPAKVWQEREPRYCAQAEVSALIQQLAPPDTFVDRRVPNGDFDSLMVHKELSRGRSRQGRNEAPAHPNG